jgi:hypothetical protein
MRQMTIAPQLGLGNVRASAGDPTGRPEHVLVHVTTVIEYVPRRLRGRDDKREGRSCEAVRRDDEADDRVDERDRWLAPLMRRVCLVGQARLHAGQPESSSSDHRVQAGRARGRSGRTPSTRMTDTIAKWTDAATSATGWVARATDVPVSVTSVSVSLAGALVNETSGPVMWDRAACPRGNPACQRDETIGHAGRPRLSS